MASALTILHVVLHKVCKITAMFYMLLKDLLKFFLLMIIWVFAKVFYSTVLLNTSSNRVVIPPYTVMSL